MDELSAILTMREKEVSRTRFIANHAAATEFLILHAESAVGKSYGVGESDAGTVVGESDAGMAANRTLANRTLANRTAARLLRIG